MGNPLHDIFTNDEPKYRGTVSFDDLESLKKCIQEIKNIKDEEIEIKGIKNIDLYVETKSGKYLLDSSGSLIKLLISLPHEKAPLDIKTDYGDYRFNLIRILTKNEIIIKTEPDPDSIIRIKIVSEKGKKTFQLTFNIESTKANNIEEMIKSCNALQYLIHYLFKFENEKKDALDILRRSEAYWTRAKKIEETINKTFNPAITNNPDEEGSILDRIYLLLVRKVPIREELRNALTITLKYNKLFEKEKLKIGLKMSYSHPEKETYQLYGEEINIYRVDTIFNAVIDSIEDNIEKQECVIKCSGTDIRPMYRVYQGFKSEEELVKMPEFNKRYEEISSAKPFEELLEEIYTE